MRRARFKRGRHAVVGAVLLDLDCTAGDVQERHSQREPTLHILPSSLDDSIRFLVSSRLRLPRLGHPTQKPTSYKLEAAKANTN